MVVELPQIRSSLRHLERLTDDRGIFEHACGPHPRFTSGYCTDDNARLLVVASRCDKSEADGTLLARIAARFLLDAQVDGGLIHNRLSFERMWIDGPSVDDCWGRSLWGFGTAVARSTDTELRNRSYEGFEIGAVARATSLRSVCFSVLGAAEILTVEKDHAGALGLMYWARNLFASLPSVSQEWLWPESRLTYANAAVAEAMMLCGEALNDHRLVLRGLDLFEWLMTIEVLNDHLSVAPSWGRGQGEKGPAFDQQPIEIAAIADAASTAKRLTSDNFWDVVLDMSINWFLGNNDSGYSMINVEHGGGHDGLEPDGVNLNLGAESTLCMISTMQHSASMWII